jgi:eukaryotic-like serine/threonine-protein kinase
MREVPTRIGPYEIVIELAAGGMATTYIAQKRGESFFERLVVVKRIHPWLIDDPNSSNMLREEARLGAALQHPHVVHVEDVTVDGREVCLVMPYVESLSLGALLKAVEQAGERLNPAVVSRIILDVLAGLDAAHEAKDLRGNPLEIVHRDVSPNNILVGTDGRSRIIDFGIARATSRLYQTRSGDMKGTIAYMSPEQLRRKELDRRADIFASGAVLYEALAGKRLFDGRDEADILIGVLADEIPSLQEHWPTESAAIDPILSRALARDRDERFPTARAFAEALEKAHAPSSAAEISELVLRFGNVEFTRRREAIRAFAESRADLAGTSATIAESFPGPKSQSTSSVTSIKSKRWLFVAGFALLATSSGALIAQFAFRRDNKTRDQIDPLNAMANDAKSAAAPIASSVARPSLDVSEMAPLNQPALVDSAGHPKSSSAPVRAIAPIREKVDKHRASELQENPYR